MAQTGTRIFQGPHALAVIGDEPEGDVAAIGPLLRPTGCTIDTDSGPVAEHELLPGYHVNTPIPVAPAAPEGWAAFEVESAPPLVLWAL